MKNPLFLLFLLSPLILHANPPLFPLQKEEYRDFDSFQSLFTQEEIAFKLQHYLQKSKEIEDHFLLTDQAFYLFAKREDKRQHRPEFVLYLSDTKRSPPPSPLPSSFNGLRVAIDPGHLGGDFAKLEERYVKMLTTKPKKAQEMIYFKEGTLALLTALQLKQWLEAEGAVVFLTKEQEGQAVYEKTFFEWFALEGYRFPLPWNALFRNHYNRLDLQARAHKINAFHPHVTLILHYNAHGQRDAMTQENVPEKFNYHIAFIGGSFCKGELETSSSRYEFLRLLLTDDFLHSLRLSEHVIAQLTEQLQVPPVRPQDPVPYLNSTSLRVGNGIYARNLALTRLIHGPVCYGESLCQDHEEECIRLNAKDLEINGIQGPQRVKQVAKAYYEALHLFIRSFPTKTSGSPHLSVQKNHPFN